ncbi:hypothetical protein OC834_003021 [Tilletia horrida]|nr:hypothetical protein OC834_003021 [Tilletia horrida]
MRIALNALLARFATLFALFIIIQGMALPTSDRNLSSASNSCSDYILLSTRGIREPQGPSLAFPALIAHVLSALPRGKEVDTPYAATPSVRETAQGVQWVWHFVLSTLQQCPHTRFAMLGYSQGALVETMAATELLDPHNPASKSAQDALRAFVFMGNPLRAPGRAGNVDENGTRSNADAKGETVLDYPLLFDGYVQRGKVLDVCWTGDPICDAAGIGGLETHRKYGDDAGVQEMGAAFLIEKLGAST